ncbi:Hint domain-containing protein [Corallococcus terminator]|uniref:Hint domain-containing protein n=1 Tax=Corallococcus terminator TaxID=2316733 RepID=UPI0011C436CD|nr:Hint domain-containing protein [Corallococcus terminator]
MRYLLNAAALLFVPGLAGAEPTQEWRCSTDDLEPEQAIARIEWARRCALTRNLNPAGPESWMVSNKAFDTSFAWAKDYKEFNTSRAYTGNIHQYNVNYYHAYALFESTPLYSVFREPMGRPTSNYWKWSHYSPRVRPLYPSFENTPVTGGGTQLFPSPTLADCDLYTDKAGTQRWTSDFFVVAYCESACYAPDQRLEFSTGEVNIVEAMQQGREDILTLHPDATLEELSLQQGKVFSYVTEIRDARHVLFELRTKSGGTLRVTHEHPVITSEGRLVQAQTLQVGDELLRRDGTPDVIVSVEKTSHFGKVYNVKPESRERVANVLVAQGFLVGSARFQSEDVGYMNRVLLFRGIPASVLPR